MADEDTKKEHHPKKFKAVTEEITPQPAVAEAEVEKSAHSEDVVLADRPSLAVAETNNITPQNEAPKHDAGIFLRFFVLTFLATLLALALAGGVYVYLTGTKRISIKSIVNSETPEPLASSSPVPAPSATPLANVDLTTFKVSVLNGNGGIGVATAAKTIIEKAGFKVSSIGNADNFNFTDTLIQVKPDVADTVVAMLKNSLSSNYSVKIGDPLSSGDNFDIVVTVGSN